MDRPNLSRTLTFKNAQLFSDDNDFFNLTSQFSASYACDQDLHAYADPSWPTSGSSWLHPVPWGLRKLLSWIKHQYPGYTEILITENGISERLGTEINLCDQQRVEFYRDYVNNVLMSIRIDEVKTPTPFYYLHYVMQFLIIDNR